MDTACNTIFIRHTELIYDCEERTPILISTLAEARLQESIYSSNISRGLNCEVWAQHKVKMDRTLAFAKMKRGMLTIWAKDDPAPDMLAATIAT